MRHLVTLISLQIGRFMTNPSGLFKRRFRGRKRNRFNRSSGLNNGLIRLNTRRLNRLDIRIQRNWQRTHQNRRIGICREMLSKRSGICSRLGRREMLNNRCGGYNRNENKNWTRRRIKTMSRWTGERK